MAIPPPNRELPGLRGHRTRGGKGGDSRTPAGGRGGEGGERVFGDRGRGEEGRAGVCGVPCVPGQGLGWVANLFVNFFYE